MIEWLMRELAQYAAHTTLAMALTWLCGLILLLLARIASK